jgi:hypothetical protein
VELAAGAAPVHVARDPLAQQLAQLRPRQGADMRIGQVGDAVHAAEQTPEPGESSAGAGPGSSGSGGIPAGPGPRKP